MIQNYAPGNVKCKINGNSQQHYFDLRSNEDLVSCKCRCGAKMSGFPGRPLYTTQIIGYKTHHMVTGM